jgi:guanylate kinase
MEAFDIFLSHNSKDKPLVEEIASTLDSVGIRPYLDMWHLIPGDPWQEILDNAISRSKACGVCVSNSGIGPWQNEEMRSFIEKRVKDNSVRVIPILLPGTTQDTITNLPPFLSRLQYVDFRSGIASIDGLKKLIAGISGSSPKDVELPFKFKQNEVYTTTCVVISGPSSVGKDVVLGRLVDLARRNSFFPELLRKYTTRPHRESESEEGPYEYLNEDEFKQKVSKNMIGCIRFSYNNYYGVDQTFSDGLKYRELLFASMRLYEEIDIFKHAAYNAGVLVKAYLLTADTDTLKARTWLRALNSEQKNLRTAQIFEDIDFLSKVNELLKGKFDLVIDNSDNVCLNKTVSTIWNSLYAELSKDRCNIKSGT